VFTGFVVTVFTGKQVFEVVTFQENASFFVAHSTVWP